MVALVSRDHTAERAHAHPILGRHAGAGKGFRGKALEQKYRRAPHGFELFHDTLETREVIRQMMRFARFHLAGTSADGVNV